MRIGWASIFVEDQARAREFYTEKLGFVVKADVPVGEDRWLTVVSREDPEGVELLLEPNGHPAVRPFTEALVASGIPATQFAVTDLQAEFERLSALGVRFVSEPQRMGPIAVAVLDDTCGNLIQLIQQDAEGE
ncbi:VOC family protein [Leucobacter sp. CSA2]|uniref:VOC family protein n=1 Tax=Leucobacter edaphi TaxID=2796472 RepID=A0A934UW86_9MICO|nr:VOC family protein [Leucobacter edaphi]MBK0421414.1 VOC family protein [Leucobacter edaphi]